MFVRCSIYIYIYIYTRIVGQIFLFAIDSHLVGPVNIQHWKSHGSTVYRIYTPKLFPSFLILLSQTVRVYVHGCWSNHPPNNSNNYFQEGNTSPFSNSLFSIALNPVLNVRFEDPSRRERRRWGKRWIRIGRKEKRRTDRPRKESLNIAKRGVIFFFHISYAFHRSVGLIKGEYLPREDRRETRPRKSILYICR